MVNNETDNYDKNHSFSSWNFCKFDMKKGKKRVRIRSDGKKK